jgi:hypothetical protein
VLSSQAGNTWRGENVLSYNNANQVTDALGIAPYFGGSYGGDASVQNWTLTQLFNDIQSSSSRGLPAARTMIASNKSMANSYNVDLICYEAGQHLVGTGGNENLTAMTTLFTSANRDSRMNGCYDTYLSNWDTEAGGLMCIFSSTSRYIKWGSWGVTEYHDQTSTPKYDAVIEWLGSAPQPPGQASNPSPGNGATGVSTSADVSWTAGSGATSHDVYFGTDSTPDSGEFKGNQTGTTYDPGALAASTTYYWRIDEKNAVGTTTGAVWSFTTGTPPAGTLNVIITTDDQYTLWVNGQQVGSDSSSGGWQSAEAYNGIALQTGENVVAVQGVDTGWDEGVLAELVIDGQRSGTSTSWKVSLSGPSGWLNPGFDDSAWANASDRGAYGTGAWGTNVAGMPADTPAHWIWSAGSEETPVYVRYKFNVGGSPPAAATSPNPANSATGVSTTADLSWTAGSGATSHDVYFGTDATPDSGEFKGNQTGTTYDTGTMANNTTYYWRIDEKNAYGTTTGTVWSFTTIVAAPGQASSPSPASGASGVSTSVDLSWAAGSGATSHDVYFGTAATPPFTQNQTGTSYDPGALAESTTYYWRIDEKNAGGTTTGAVWNFTTVGGLPPGSGTGLTGDYYDNMDFTAFTLSRTDSTVNFDWGSGSPDAAIGADTFSVSWMGDVEPQYSETYTFYTTSDDGVRLWVNDQLIVENWTDHASTVNSGTIALAAGLKYDIQMDYYENGGGAVAKLEWSSPSQARQIIPQSQLYPIVTDANVAQTWTAPVIDGAVDSVWAGAGWYPINNVTIGTVGGASDLSGNWKAMWDSTNLYYLVEISDEALRTDSASTWDDDTIEIFIDADDSKGTSYDGVNDFQYGLRYNDATVYIGSNSVNDSTGVVHAWATISGGYRLEIRVPWSTLGVTPAGDGLIGTDVQVNDDDDGGSRDSKKAWFATNDNSWQDPSLFGTAVLTTSIAPPGQASSPSPSDQATGIGTDTDLSWTAGSGATSHDVYFGSVSSPPFVGNQAGTTYDPGTLGEATTYYWRIDEVGEGGTTAGDVWSFVTGSSVCTEDYCIKAAPSAPTIDGSVDSVWSQAPTEPIANVINGSVSGDSDLSGTWRAMWDSSRLYYLVEVTDDSLRNDSANAWDDDSVELYIDADNSKGSSYDGVNDFQYVFRWNDGTIHLGSSSASNTTGITFDMVAVSGGYNFEVSIPWTTLGVTPGTGSLIGTDVHINDDDDGSSRDGKKAWFATTDDSWGNPSLFATAELRN